MAKKSPSDSISIELLNYPQSLLLGNQDYELSFSVKNNSESIESYAFNFTSTTSDISVDKSYIKGVSFNSGESKIVPVKIRPKIEGLTELNVIIYYQKKIEFKSMDWKIKKNVEKSIVSKIIGKTQVNFDDLKGYKKKLPKSISLGDIPSLSKSKAKKELDKIKSVPSIKVHTREIERKIITQVPKTITKQVPEKIIKKIPRVIEEIIPQEPLVNAINGKKFERPPLKTTKTVYESIEETVMKTVTETVYEEKIETKIDIVEDTTLPSKKGEITLKQKDETLSRIAKGVFNQDPQYAFAIVKMISDPNKRYTNISQFVPPGIRLDSKTTIEAVMGLDLGPQKEALIEIIANSLAAEKPDEAAMIALNIDNIAKRDEIITNIIFTAAYLKPQIASNLIYQLSKKELQHQILFELVKGWAHKDKKRAIESLKSLISNILSESNIELIKTCMIFLAYLTDPQSVYDLIDGFRSKDDKSLLVEQLQEYLKVKVQTKKIKLESQELSKLYFTFTAISKKITPALNYLVELKGNISSNLIEGNISSNIIVICPFKFNFPIFMNFQSCYVELLQETQKTFGFLLFPSKENYSEEELKHFHNILNNFIKNQTNQHPSPFVIINLDLIPYFSKPTIFLGDNGDPLIKDIHSKLKGNFTNEINLMINNSFFSQGKSFIELQNILKEPNFRICNIVLTYNFLNDIGLLKTFFKAILS
ncbi:hypothetical protein DSAG12_01769 [Promethearchaeum syntrophicum]|uniref:Uncharacterized protein n=1 Tax=Promethearchaeum syntrophicum TaxID=2594042 RepID=A0A5B9DA09_9ARCH